jgi:hypothetical protein
MAAEPTPEQQDMIAALSRAMSTIPGLDPNHARTPVNAAVRHAWATELVTKWGVSIDPDKATVEAVSTAPPQFGNLGPHTVRPRAQAAPDAAEYLRKNGPDFMAQNRPDLAARMAAAKTPEQRAALAEELRQSILANPNTLVTDFVALLQDPPK